MSRIESIPSQSERAKSTSSRRTTQTLIDLKKHEVNKKKHPRVYTYTNAGDLKDRVDQIISELENIKCYLEGKIDVVEKMNLLMSIITYKVYEMRYEFSTSMGDLERAKESLGQSDMDSNQVDVEVEKLRKLTIELELKHREKIQNFNQQKLDLQLEYETTTGIMDEELESMQKHTDRLKVEMSRNLSERGSDYRIVDRQIRTALEKYEEIMKDFGKKQMNGWKIQDSDEEVVEKLANRGLVVTMSGMLLTKSGEKISCGEAERRHLLGGLDVKERLYPSVTRPQETSSKDTTIPAPPPPSHKESEYSFMSSADVTYIKTTLGKPLSLALAEITRIQPKDPIHYLGHWLFKYRFNLELSELQKREREELLMERKRLAEARLHKMYEDEATLVLMEMITKAENEVFQNQIQRMLKEQWLAEEEADELERIRQSKRSTKRSNVPSVSGTTKVSIVDPTPRSSQLQ